MRGFPPAGVSALATKKKPRAAAAWQKAAAVEIATNWGGCQWGDGRRFRVQPVAPGQAPQGDQAAVGNAAEQEPAAPAAPASEGRSGGSGSHPVAAADGPQGDGKPVAPGQAPQGDQASVGNVAEQKVGSPAALASTARSSSAQVSPCRINAKTAPAAHRPMSGIGRPQAFMVTLTPEPICTRADRPSYEAAGPPSPAGTMPALPPPWHDNEVATTPETAQGLGGDIDATPPNTRRLISKG